MIGSSLVSDPREQPRHVAVVMPTSPPRSPPPAKAKPRPHDPTRHNHPPGMITPVETPGSGTHGVGGLHALGVDRPGRGQRTAPAPEADSGPQRIDQPLRQAPPAPPFEERVHRRVRREVGRQCATRSRTGSRTRPRRASRASRGPSAVPTRVPARPSPHEPRVRAWPTARRSDPRDSAVSGRDTDSPGWRSWCPLPWSGRQAPRLLVVEAA